MTRFHTTSAGNVPFTVDEELQQDAEEAAYEASKGFKKAKNVREARNTLIAATDWTQLPDVSQTTKDKWVPYRKALRDVPQQAGFPFSVVWPT